ncbi:MAG: ABC transporter permease, partial [Bacteroidia bacterium]|nr:ABC transporter permease [Bacteroidia bacterium]
MKKIWLVLQREYLVRVRKRAFILMTFLTPLIFAGIFVAPILLSQEFQDDKVIEVIDKTGKIRERLSDEDQLSFVPSEYQSLEEAEKQLPSSDHYAILYIPKTNLDNPEGMRLLGKKSISLDLEMKITEKVEQAIEDIKLTQKGIDQKVLDAIETRVSLDTEKLGGEKSSSVAAYLIGVIVSLLIYMSLILYSQQVMRGIVEEKASRIIEVIISSVKPFQLMMGKILGVALIGLTQFVLWILLTFAIITGLSTFLNTEDYVRQQSEQVAASRGENNAQEDANSQIIMQRIGQEFANVPFAMILGCFLFYFLGGYLLYSAMFAAVASAADTETDTQQYVLPLSAPLIIAIVAFQAVLNNPDGAVAFWMSIIPLTSPIIMMIRIPFGGVLAWELILSMVLLVAGFLFTTWLAARIYRVGILMYGKKVS